MKKVKLEHFSDAGMYLFFKNGIKSGVSYISKRYSKANNKYLKPHDPKRELKDIIYIVANNLHGNAMSKFLPVSGLERTDPKNFDSNKYSKQ